MRRKNRHGIKVSLIIITATSLALTLTTLAYYLMQYRESDLINEQIADIAFGDEGGTGSQTPNGSIDHAALLAVNGDYAGWLMVEGTDISYPIVYSNQELFYLRRDFNKNNSVAGTVFMDDKNNKNFSDTNTMLYGHNMKNGSMFAPLKNFLQKDFFEANRFVYISTLQGDFRYEIFAVYEVKADAVPYMPGMLGGEKLGQLLIRIKDLALYEKETKTTESDKILTLATCGYNLKDARIVIHAKLVED
jgi:sortase B